MKGRLRAFRESQILTFMNGDAARVLGLQYDSNYGL
jgi:hypothetical protein